MKILWIDNVCVCVCVLIEVNVERCATCGLTVQIRIEHGVSTCAQMDETVVNTGITIIQESGVYSRRRPRGNIVYRIIGKGARDRFLLEENSVGFSTLSSFSNSRRKRRTENCSFSQSRNDLAHTHTHTYI